MQKLVQKHLYTGKNETFVTFFYILAKINQNKTNYEKNYTIIFTV